MSERRSETTDKSYGARRVCSTLDVPRSSFCKKKRRERSKERKHKKRGPVPAVSGDELLVLIRGDLATSYFVGEGHRKVWARLIECGVRVSRKRVLRLMKNNNLPSACRRPQMPPNEHDGKIVTHAPNIMWRTDGVKDLHPLKRMELDFRERRALERSSAWARTSARRASALPHSEPVSIDVMAEYGSVERETARGLSLRMGHGTQCLSNHFQSQIEAWDIAKSFAFLEQPQTNGAAERFLRAPQEQAIYGRVFDTIEAGRQAAAEFAELHNSKWLNEKNGYLSPCQAREAYYEAQEKAAA